MIYSNFECVLLPSTDNSYNGLNIKQYHDHIVGSYGYKVVVVDDIVLMSSKVNLPIGSPK